MLTRLGSTLWDHSNIQAIKDLRGLKMVDRQGGAGTWILSNYLLGLEGIEPLETPGYDHKAATRLAAVLAAKSKDVGFAVGIGSAAIRMGLDFIYPQDEDYGLALKKESLKLEPIQELIQMLEPQAFKNAVDTLGGYTASQSGHVRYYEG